MRDFVKWVILSAMPLWIVLIGGAFMIIGGVNDCYNCNSIFDAVLVANNFWAGLGLILMSAGFLLVAWRLVRKYMIKK